MAPVESEYEVRVADLLDEALSWLRTGQPTDPAALQARYPEVANEAIPLLQVMRILDGAAANWKAGNTFNESEASTGAYDPVHDPDANNALPERFGRYRVVSFLGAGGMGNVYQAEDQQLKRIVAVKTLRIDRRCPDKGLARQRFQREARTAARIRHPHICPIYDVGEEDGLPYAVMAYIEGLTLADFLQQQRPDSVRAVKLVRKVARGLEAIHAQGIIHRDLKPANILLDSKGEPLLTDFGLARPGTDGEGLTREGAVMGTWGYMAPEQAAGETAKIGPWSDVYSLGVVLFKLITGDLPGLQDPHLANLPPELEPTLKNILLKALAHTPLDRYQSASQFADALDGWSVAADAPSAPQRLGVRAAIATALLLVVGLLLASGLLMLLTDNTGEQPAAVSKNKTSKSNDRKVIANQVEQFPKAVPIKPKVPNTTIVPNDTEPMVLEMTSKLGLETRVSVVKTFTIDPDTRDKNGNVVSSLRNELERVFGGTDNSICLAQGNGLFVLIPLGQVESVEAQDKQHLVTLTDGTKQRGNLLATVIGKDKQQYALANAKTIKVIARERTKPVDNKVAVAVVTLPERAAPQFRMATYNFPLPPRGPIKMIVDGERVEGAVAGFKKVTVARDNEDWRITVTAPSGKKITGHLEIRFGRWWLHGQTSNGWHIVLSSIHGSKGFTLEKAGPPNPAGKARAGVE